MLTLLVHSPRETPAVQSTVLESSSFYRALEDLMDQLGSRGPRARRYRIPAGVYLLPLPP